MAGFSLWLQNFRKTAHELDGQAASTSINEPLWTSNFVRMWINNLTLSVWYFVLNAPFPFYIIDLGGTELLVGITAGGFALSAFAIRPLAGWLLDYHSRKSLLIWGTILLILISLLHLLIPVLAISVVLRVMSGVVFSAAGTASLTNTCDSIPKSRFGEGLGYLGLGSSVASALGPAVGLAIIASFGFRSLFAVSIATLLLSALTVWGFKFNEVTRSDDSEQREKLKLSTLFNADALPASVVMLFAGIPYGAISVFIALYGEFYNLGSGAWFFILMAVGTASTRLFSGRITDKKGEQPMIIAGNSGLLLALVLLLIENSAIYYVSGLLYGIGFGLTIPAIQTMAMRIVPIEKRGSASSTYQSSYDFSNGIGGLIAGGLVTIWGYRPMFAVMCVFIVIATFVYFLWAAKTPSAFKVYRRNM